MKKIIYYIVLVILFTNCNENSDISGRELFFGEDANPQIQLAKNYEAFPIAQRTTFFIENFNNNSNNWPISLPNSIPNHFYFCYINNGFYKMRGEDNVYYQSSILKQIDQTKNFDIEISYSIYSNSQISNTGLAFGNTSIDNGYFISLNSGSTPNLKIEFNSTNNTISKELATSIPDNDWANHYPIKLTCRKVSNSVLFFVNQQYLGKIPFQEFIGNYIGFRALPETHFDYLKIDYLTF